MNERMLKRIGKLPNKLSALLRAAVADCKAVSKDKRYVLNMHYWHEYDADAKKCCVCMAGAVLANTVKIPLKETVVVFGCGGPEEDKMIAIDQARFGALYAAVSYMYVEPSADQIETLKRLGDVIGVKFNPKLGRAPWGAYLKVADEREAAGL